MSILLKICGLIPGYGTASGAGLVKDGFDAEVSAGERVAIMGLNGCGKSTLLKTLTGMLPPMAGKIELAGLDIHAEGAGERAKKVAAVFTQYHDPGRITVRELVSFGRYPYTGPINRLADDDRRLIEKAMQMTDVKQLAGRIIGELSDGERQKVMIAVAVAQDTPLIVLDEPDSHLDIRNKFMITRLIKKLAGISHKAVIFSSHDTALVREAATRVWLFHDQKILDHEAGEFSKGGFWKLMLDGPDIPDLAD